MYCTNCGAEIDPDDVFCPECGEDIEEDIESTERVSSQGNTLKVLTIILAAALLCTAISTGVLAAKLSSRNGAENARVEEYKKQLSDKESEIKEVTAQLNDAEDTVEDLHKQLSDKDDEITELNNRLANENVEIHVHTGGEDQNLVIPDYADSSYSDSQQIFPYSSEYKLTDEEVNRLSPELAQAAINEIYARNGYIFKDKEKQAYYESMPGYYGISGDQKEIKEYMNSCEKYNIKKLAKIR